MFKLSNQQLNNSLFMQTVKMLGNHRFSDKKVLWNLNKMFKCIDKANARAAEKYMEITKKYVEVDENGQIKPDLDEKGNPIPQSYIIIEDKKDEFKAEVIKFMSTKHDINAYKLRMDDLDEVPLSLTDLEVLKPLLVHLEEVEEEEEEEEEKGEVLEQQEMDLE